MQQKTNFLYLLIITIFASSLTFIIIYKFDKSVENTEESLFFSQKNNLVLYKNSTSGYTLNLSKGVITKESGENVDFSFPNVKFLVDENYGNLNRVGSGFSLSTSMKSLEPDLSLREWWDIYGFYGSRQSPTPYEVKDINTKKGFTGIQLIFLSNQNNFGLKYYNTVITLLVRNNSVYQFQSYQLPENPSPDLAPEDIAAAREYEKKFAAILESIEFLPPLPSVPTSSTEKPQLE